MALIWCLFMCFCASVLGFNVDIESRVVHQGTPNSMFGFAVQAHVEGDHKMLLVGAPEADTRRRPDVERPGAVYRCEPSLPGRCREMVFDYNGNNKDRQNRQVDKKSDQWFGATLTSTGANGPIVACAPRYVSFVTAKHDNRDPVGTCFLAKSASTSNFTEFSPCRIASHGQRKTGVCQAGFAAAISKDGQRLFMGAPGSFYWQGQLYSQSLAQKPTLISTPEANPKYDDSYMGYSVTVGDFAGQAIQGVAVGVPRGSDLRGLVVLYTWELQNIKNISGSQIGAYFGYSLASGDIDGDGYDDIIVGAPMFTRPKTEGFEHGRVYVIYQGRDRSFERNHARTGEVSRGRFGLSVASLGDINLDGFGDFAVGAPYGGANGRGVVFIYHGSELGAREKHSQAITAEEVSSPPFYINTFGFSLSGGVDLDNNNYTDLIVGAYKSDSVIYFRSRPVVKVMAEVRFMGESKLISLEDKKCTLRNGTSVVCAHLMFCLTYDGINVNRQINFNVTLDLDSKQKTSKRIFLMESRQTSYSEHILLVQGKQGCREIDVYLDEEIRDKLTPIEVAMSYELMTQYSGDVIPPVLDQTSTNVVTDSLNIQKNCGPDNVCIPDLKMAVTTPTINYVLGSSENVNIDVSIRNDGEDAFEAAYFLNIPPGVTYAKMERLDADDADSSPVYCSIIHRDGSGNSTLKCDLGNPMQSRQSSKFRIILEVDSLVTQLMFEMESNSTNPERGTEYDNTRRLVIGVVVKAQLSIIGTSDPPELHYNASLYELSPDLSSDVKLGPQLIHKYNIKNEGPYAVDEAEIVILWPYQTLDGDHLMYMLVQPEWLGDMQCDTARHVNPDNLFVHNAYSSPLIAEREAMLSSDLYKELKFNRGGGYYGQTYLEEGISRESASSGSRKTSGGTQTQITRHRDDEEVYGQGFNSQEEETIRQNTASLASRSGGYNHQGSYAEGQGYNYQEEENRRNIAGRTGSNGYQATYDEGQGFSAQEEANIRRNIASAVSSRSGSGVRGAGDGHVIRIRNKTITYDEKGNVINQVESSTEYGSLGREGEAGSYFSNRYGIDVTLNRQNSGRQDTQGHVVYSSGRNNDQRHTWSTEESVNRDIINAGSSAFRGGSKTTVVGDESDEIGGLGAYAARGSNNEFKYGIADIGIAGSEGQSSGSRRHEESRGYSAGSQSHGAGSQSYGAGSQSYGAGSQSYGAGSQSYGAGSQSYGAGSQGYAAGTGGGHGYHRQSGSAYESRSSGGGYSYAASSEAANSYNSHSEDSYSSRRDNTRRRREEPVDTQLKEMLEKCEEKYKCEVIRCTTGRLVKGQEVWLALRSRINATVLNEISQDRAVKLSTLAATRVARLPMVGRPSDVTWHTAEAQTVITPQLEALSSGNIPLWVVILAAVIGTLLLLLLIFALYKCGFFKRNRPSDHAERQPLNGRDEHL